MAGMKFTGNKTSSFSCMVEIALKMKGVNYEFVEDKTAELPLLLHNGKKIADSSIILEYVEENWKEQPLLPRDLHERAQARFISKFVERMVIPALENAYMNKGNQQVMAFASDILKALEEKLHGKTFFGGNSIGLADISATYIGYWVGIIQQVSGIQVLTKATHPKLSKWCEDYVASPSVKATLPPRQTVTTYYQNVFHVGGGSHSRFTLM